MNQEDKLMRLLLCIALVLSGVIIAFNAFYAPDFSPVETAYLPSAGSAASASLSSLGSGAPSTNEDGEASDGEPPSGERGESPAEQSEDSAAAAGSSRPASSKPSSSTAKKSASSSKPPAKGSQVVNINTADKAALMLIPGVGEVIAQRILDYRSQYGAFSSADELVKIKGIGEKTLEKMRPYVTT